MALLKNYVAEIGTATENEAKMALGRLLYRRFTERFRESECLFDGSEESDYEEGSEEVNKSIYLLAALCVNRLFGEKARTDEALAFEKQFPEMVDEECKRLSSEESLCILLTGAAYNSSYARYIRAGGSTGLFSNIFLKYIRTLRRGISYEELQTKYFLEILMLNPIIDILGPMCAIQALGIFRGLPDNPNEKAYYKAVHEFAVSEGVVFL